MVLKPSSAAIPPMTSSVVRRPQHPQRLHPVELEVLVDLELEVLVDLEQEAVDLEVADLEPVLADLEVGGWEVRGPDLRSEEDEGLGGAEV